MKNSSYGELINWLFHQFPAFQKIGSTAYKPTLENTLKLIDSFDISLDDLKFIHVAGTNGKGTTCSILSSVLQESKYKTGLFTSPHIHDFRERIKVNGEMIEKIKVEAFIKQVKSIDWDIKPSFFEITWVLALKHFVESKCEIVVVETGLGGRLDATNVITPIVSVITNIGLDHTSILGNTKPEIAREKAGIIKPNIPVFIGEKNVETAPVFKEVSQKLDAEMIFINNQEFSVFEQNKQLAFSVLKYLAGQGWSISDKNFTNGIKNLYKNTGLKGRLQIISDNPLIIADAAHNKEGISALINFIKQSYPDKSVHAIYGASNDKSLEEIVPIFPVYWNYYFTSFKNVRSFTQLELIKKTALLSADKEYFNSSEKAIVKAQSSLDKNSMVLVFGSFFLLEEII
ncbi:MAG: tetrahydrofolate synthase [Fluviicola sp.]|nr:MAG: tetrahydrofolate synthase [Fluviicola sp.]